MSIAYGLTEDCRSAQWFDTYDAALAAHQQSSPRWEWRILVYGYAQQLATIVYHPRVGYMWNSQIDGEGESLTEKYAVALEQSGAPKG